jgi:hypothetical protein
VKILSDSRIHLPPASIKDILLSIKYQWNRASAEVYQKYNALYKNNQNNGWNSAKQHA